jgi:hypothetical protein
LKNLRFKTTRAQSPDHNLPCATSVTVATYEHHDDLQRTLHPRPVLGGSSPVIKPDDTHTNTLHNSPPHAPIGIHSSGMQTREAITTSHFTNFTRELLRSNSPTSFSLTLSYVDRENTQIAATLPFWFGTLVHDGLNSLEARAQASVSPYPPATFHTMADQRVGDGHIISAFAAAGDLLVTHRNTRISRHLANPATVLVTQALLLITIGHTSVHELNSTIDTAFQRFDDADSPRACRPTPSPRVACLASLGDNAASDSSPTVSVLNDRREHVHGTGLVFVRLDSLWP